MLRPTWIPAAAAAILLGASEAPANHCATHSNSAQAAGSASMEKAEKPTIVETAVAAGDFQTLTTALTEAGLVEALGAEGPFTVFAPTDEAFAKLPEGTVDELLRPENRDKLVAILTYHVVEGKLDSDHVTKLSGAESLNGQRLQFAAAEGVKVDDARVVQADIECGNGIIHVVDTVLLPN
jgi:uncharacterized surface protein with fasciclin (FAS1) repeats